MIAVARVDAALQTFELGSKRNALFFIGAGKGSLRLFEAGDKTAVFFKHFAHSRKDGAFRFQPAVLRKIADFEVVLAEDIALIGREFVKKQP